MTDIYYKILTKKGNLKEICSIKHRGPFYTVIAENSFVLLKNPVKIHCKFNFNLNLDKIQ